MLSQLYRQLELAQTRGCPRCPNSPQAHNLGLLCACGWSGCWLEGPDSYPEVLTLYRPVGRLELELIAASGWRRFPPRLPIQPIFYPVCNLEYACDIARDWNTRDPESDFIGIVLAFEVPGDITRRYPIQRAGAAHHLELWVPAEDLDAFNDAIVGTIREVTRFTP